MVLQLWRSESLGRCAFEISILTFPALIGFDHSQDCKATHRRDRPVEPSAFGLNNISTGPFYDHAEFKKRPERRLRDWERDNDAWNNHAPDGVGRQGKKRMMERMRKAAKNFEEESDPDDWFRNLRNMRSRETDGPLSRSDRDGDRRRDRDKRDKDRARNWDLYRARRRDRDRKRERERESDNARGRHRVEQDRPSEQGHDKAYPDRERIKISFKHNLPPRPPSTTRPSLLARIGDPDPVDSPGPSKKSSQRDRSGTLSFSIRGAGQRATGDDSYTQHRPAGDRPGPRYQGGYGR